MKCLLLLRFKLSIGTYIPRPLRRRHKATEEIPRFPLLTKRTYKRRSDSKRQKKKKGRRGEKEGGKKKKKKKVRRVDKEVRIH